MTGFVTMVSMLYTRHANPSITADLGDQSLRPSRSRWRGISIWDEMGMDKYDDNIPKRLLIGIVFHEL